MYRFMGILVALLLNILLVNGQEKYPVPSSPNQLFYLQKNTNTNTIVCELNYKNGVLDASDPVHVFWMRYQEQGQAKELNYIQRTFAYGIKSSLIAKDKYKLHFVSLKKYPMILKRGTNYKYNVYATINQKEAILHRIFVKINGGTFWSPNVEYIELRGSDPITGIETVERLKI
jgi:hypothetical protein